MLKNLNGFIYRIDEVSIKDFYAMTQEQKNDYISQIVDIPAEERTTMQKHIVKFYTIQPKIENRKFFSLDL
jgi:hypothetical protein